jgi:integrase
MARSRRGRSEGSIFFRESDKQWVGTISLGYDGEGKRKRRAVYGASKREVQEKIQALQGKALSGANLDVVKLTVGAFLERWLETTAKSSVRPTTLERYGVLVRRHLIPVIGMTQLSKLHAMHIEGMYAEMERAGASAWTRRMSGTLLGNALKHAVRLKLIGSNPVRDVAKARPLEKEMQFLTEAQSRAFLSAAEGRRLYALFALAIGSGMRQGELLGLQWADIDFQAGTVAVVRTLGTVQNKFILKEPKSKRSRRTIRLPAFAIAALQSHRAAMLAEGNIAAPVFCTRAGQFITKSNLTRQVFRPILKAANANAVKVATELKTEPVLLPAIRFHDLRHTHATMLLARGKSVKAVSQRLGHASIEITLKHYAHVLPEDDSALAKDVERMLG